eukprot:scaffold182561_cov36-Tisochrysis_lutea.AAC.8
MAELDHANGNMVAALPCHHLGVGGAWRNGWLPRNISDYTQPPVAKACDEPGTTDGKSKASIIAYLMPSTQKPRMVPAILHTLAIASMGHTAQ